MLLSHGKGPNCEGGETMVIPSNKSIEKSRDGLSKHKPHMASRGRCAQDLQLQKDSPIYAILAWWWGGGWLIFMIQALAMALSTSIDGSSALTIPS